MKETSSQSVTRWLAVGRLVWGIALLAAPQKVFRAASGAAGTRGATDIVRVLGLRETSHAAIAIAAPTAPVVAAGAAVDGIHALSMVGLAAASSRYRRPALLSAAIATCASAAGLMLHRSEAWRGRSSGWADRLGRRLSPRDKAGADLWSTGL